VDSQLLPSTLTPISVAGYLALRQGTSSGLAPQATGLGSAGSTADANAASGAASSTVDGQAWMAAQTAGTEESYGRYLAEFPAGQFAQQARTRREGIAEDSLWRRTVTSAREEDYAQYLHKHPNGRYSATASLRAGSWVRTDTGCLFRGELLKLNPLANPNWSGSCSGGLAEGKGIVGGLNGGKPSSIECDLRQGRCFGPVTFRSTDTTTQADALIDGFPAGRVRVRGTNLDMSGNVVNRVMTIQTGQLQNGLQLIGGSLVFEENNKMRGSMLVKTPQGITAKMELGTDGNCTGNIEFYMPNGATMVGPCVNNVPDGQFLLRFPNGAQQVMIFSKGNLVAR
jgi:hypothetical protein